MGNNDSFINRVQRVTSASKRRIKLKSMHDVSAINSSLGNIGFPKVIKKNRIGAHEGEQPVAPSNFS
jgi:hypothetical protein